MSATTDKKIKTVIAYVTKYSLTTGTEEVTGEVEGKMLIIRGKYCTYYHGNEWHMTLEDAYKRFEEMRESELTRLRKKTTRIANLKFKVKQDSLVKFAESLQP